MPYFAYCTLLDEDEMRRFVPTARIGATGLITDHRVVFERHAPGAETGGCNVTPADGYVVNGVLYDLNDDEFSQLDTFSGVDRGLYRRFTVQVETRHGVVEAETYMIPNPGGPFRPSAAYTRPIITGARTLGLPEGYVAELEATIRSATA